MILDSMLYKPCLEYLKKEPYSGSIQGMRYRLWKKTEKDEETGKDKVTGLMAAAYPDEFCFEVTEEEKKHINDFEFSDSGIDQALAWLSECQETLF